MKPLWPMRLPRSSASSGTNRHRRRVFVQRLGLPPLNPLGLPPDLPWPPGFQSAPYSMIPTGSSSLVLVWFWAPPVGSACGFPLWEPPGEPDLQLVVLVEAIVEPVPGLDSCSILVHVPKTNLSCLPSNSSFHTRGRLAAPGPGPRMRLLAPGRGCDPPRCRGAVSVTGTGNFPSRDS